MSFHEIQFPDDIAKGSAGGPGFKVEIITLDSRAEERVLKHQTPQYRYDVGYGLRNHDDCYDVLSFFIRRQGAFNGFRFKDWLDHATTAHGRTWNTPETVTNADVQIGTGDGNTQTFQLIKTYTDALVTRNRTIYKPVSGTVLVAVNAVAKTEGVDYTVDYTAGTITFGTAPTLGHAITAGFEFDVPVRFDLTEEELRAQIQGYGGTNIPSIPLIEDVDPIEGPEEFFMGGAKSYDTSSNILLSQLGHRVLVINPGVNNLVLGLPTSLNNFDLGGPYWYVFNIHGTNSLVIKNGLAGSTVSTLGPGDSCSILLGTFGGTKTWYGHENV